MAVSILGTTRISGTSFYLQTPNIFAFPEWGGENQNVSVPHFSNAKTHPVQVPLAPSAAIEVLHLQGLQKRQIHRCPILSSASLKSPRINKERGEQNRLSMTLCFSGDTSGALKQGTRTKKWRRDIGKTEKCFLPAVSAKYSHCICSIGQKCIFYS